MTQSQRIIALTKKFILLQWIGPSFKILPKNLKKVVL